MRVCKHHDSSVPIHCLLILCLYADYPDIEIVMGAGNESHFHLSALLTEIHFQGALSGDISGTMRNMLGITDEFFETVYKGIIGKHAFGLVPILMQPKSRGRIKLKSTNPFQWPSMQPNYLDDTTDDVQRLIKGVRIVSHKMHIEVVLHCNKAILCVGFKNCSVPAI